MREIHGILNAVPNVDAALLRSDIVDAWLGLVSAKPPWHAMAMDDRLGSVRGIVGMLVDPRAAVDDQARGCRLCRAARAHGEFRRRQQCPLETVSEEIGLIQEAMVNVMRRGGASRWAVEAVLKASRSDMNSVEQAALGGFRDWDTPR